MWDFYFDCLILLPEHEMRSKSRERRDCFRFVIVKSLIKRYFTLLECVGDLFENKFRFRINNGRWADIPKRRIPEINLFGCYINMLSIMVAISSVIRDGLVMTDMRD